MYTCSELFAFLTSGSHVRLSLPISLTLVQPIQMTLTAGGHNDTQQLDSRMRTTNWLCDNSREPLLNFQLIF